jgi:hypothetical protein
MLYYLTPTSGKVLPFLGAGNFFVGGVQYGYLREVVIPLHQFAVDDVF